MSVGRLLAPWSGMIAAIVGWSVSHQVGSDSVFDDCSHGSGIVLLVSVLGLIVTVVGGAVSILSRAGGSGSEGRRFAALLSALLAALAGFAILLQIAAGLILPPCAA